MANHSIAVAEAFHPRHVVAFERDGAVLNLARDRISSWSSSATATPTQFHLHRASYATLRRDTHLVDALNVEYADYILMDLGVCSVQLDHSKQLGTGMSFKTDAELDMRFDRESSSSTLTAHAIINDYTEAELADVIRSYGEDDRYRQVAAAVVSQRPITTTHELIEKTRHVISSPRGPNAKNGWTKLFQALRMEVNDEIGHLRRGLAAALECLRAPDEDVVTIGSDSARSATTSFATTARKPSSSSSPRGALAVISFHSLEDREVKTFFKEAVRNQRAIREEMIVPDAVEVRENPRARSAKLRVLYV